MVELPMICRIATDFGDVWSVAAHERLWRAGNHNQRAVEDKILSIATRWAFRSWCREHPFSELVMGVTPVDTPFLDVVTRRTHG